MPQYEQIHANTGEFKRSIILDTHCTYGNYKQWTKLYGNYAQK